MFKLIKDQISIWHIFIPFVFCIARFTTSERLLHFFYALIFSILPIIVFLYLNKRYKFHQIIVSENKIAQAHMILMILFVIFLGSWIPDIDWLFKRHRSPLTHSALPFILMKKVVNINNKLFNQFLLSFFGFGLASHLITDLFPMGNLVMIPAPFEVPFLVLNGIWLINQSYNLYKKTFIQ